MSKIILTFIITALFTTELLAQNVEYNVLYDSDKYALTETHQLALNEFLSDSNYNNIVKVELIGHTDSDASDEYNLKLSQSRVEGVHDFLIAKGIAESLFETSFLGETLPRADNSTPEGKQANRRVQVKIAYKAPIVKTKVKKIAPPYLLCYDDTLIQLPTGGFYKINICDYKENPNCVSIKEINTAETLSESGLNTMSEDGTALISAGMVQYDICKNVTVQYFLPVREGCDSEDMTEWELTEGDSWHQVSKEKLRPVVVNGASYYQLGLSGGGARNCDKRPDPAPKPIPRKTRFKVRGRSGIQLESVSLYCDCPLQGSMQSSKKNKKRKVVFQRSNQCCPSMLVNVKATDAEGNTLEFTQRPLSELKGNTWMGSCRADIRKEWWVFRTWNKQMHRKYKLTLEDFE